MWTWPLSERKPIVNVVRSQNVLQPIIWFLKSCFREKISYFWFQVFLVLKIFLGDCRHAEPWRGNGSVRISRKEGEVSFFFVNQDSYHSRLQRPRSFCPAPRIVTSGKAQFFFTCRVMEWRLLEWDWRLISKSLFSELSFSRSAGQR